MSDETESEDRGLSASPRPDVAAFASTVISVLNGRSCDPAEDINPKAFSAMMSPVMDDAPFQAERLLNTLTGLNVPVEDIVDIYIPKCARELGALWNKDQLSFAKVTIGSARLQALLTLAAPPWSEPGLADSRAPSILFVLHKQSAHTLGPHVATAQLRRYGASVHVMFGCQIEELAEELIQEPRDVILFSCACSRDATVIGEHIAAIRDAIPQCPPIVVGGTYLEATNEIKEKTSADLVSSDTKVVYQLGQRRKNNGENGRRSP